MYLDDVLQNVKGWAKEAGKIQMSYFRKASLQIESKSSQVDLVTEADKKSEAYILEAIKKLTQTIAYCQKKQV